MNKNLKLVGVVGVVLLAVFMVGRQFMGPAKSSKGSLYDEIRASRENRAQQLREQEQERDVASSREIRVALGPLGFRDAVSEKQALNLMVKELEELTGIEVIPQREFDSKASEAGVKWGSLTLGEGIVSLGKSLNADVLVLGSEVVSGGEPMLLVRLLDVGTGVVRDLALLASGQESSQVESELISFVKGGLRERNGGEERVFFSVRSFETMNGKADPENWNTALEGAVAKAFLDAGGLAVDEELMVAIMAMVQSSLAGMKETGGPVPVPSNSFWLLDGWYHAPVGGKEKVRAGIRMNKILSGTWRTGIDLEGKDRSSDVIYSQVSKMLAESKLLGAKVLPRGPEVDQLVSQARDLCKIKFNAWGGYYFGNWNDFQTDPGKISRDFENALALLDSVLALEPDHFEAKLYKAIAFTHPHLQQYPNADALFWEIIATEPNASQVERAKQLLVSSYVDTYWRDPEVLEVERAISWCQEFMVGASGTEQRQGYQSALEYLGKIEQGGAEYLRQRKSHVSKNQVKDLLQAFAEDYQNTGEFEGFLKNILLYTTELGGSGDKKQRYKEWIHELVTEFPDFKEHIYLRAGSPSLKSELGKEIIGSIQEAISNPDTLVDPKAYFNSLLKNKWDFIWHEKNLELLEKIEKGYSIALKKGLAEDPDDFKKIRFGTYLFAQKDYSGALKYLDGMYDKVIFSGGNGYWGDSRMPVFPGYYISECRKALGMPPMAPPPGYFSVRGRTIIEVQEVTNGMWEYIEDQGTVWVAGEKGVGQLRADGRVDWKGAYPFGMEVEPSCIVQNGDRIWIGTDGQGLLEYNRKENSFRPYDTDDGLILDHISALHLEGDRLWIGFAWNQEKGGLGYLDRKAGSFHALAPILVEANAGDTRTMFNQSLLDQPNGPPRNPVLAIRQVRDGEIWVCVQNKGVQRFDVHKNHWETLVFNHLERDLTSLALDNNSIWVGWKGDEHWVGQEQKHVINFGITGYDSTLDSFVTLEPGQTLPHWTIKVVELDDGNLWLGGHGIVAVVDSKTRKIITKTILYVPEIHSIRPHGQEMWIQTPRHLVKVPRSMGELMKSN